MLLFKGIARRAEDFYIFSFLCLRRVTFVLLEYSVPRPQARLFPQLSWKSRGKRALSKNFSVILSVCWFTNLIRRIVTSDSIGQLWHIFFSNFNKSDKWKIYRLCTSCFFCKCPWELLFWLIFVTKYIKYFE